MAPIEEIFCEIDDFCKRFFPAFERGLLPKEGGKRLRSSRMNASEIMTILIFFHLSHYRDFKNFYLDCVHRQLGAYFLLCVHSLNQKQLCLQVCILSIAQL